MTEKALIRKIEELEDINHRIRLENRRLRWKLEKRTVQSAQFLKHTMKIFEMCRIDWRDVVRLYFYSIEQEKHDRNIKRDS